MRLLLIALTCLVASSALPDQKPKRGILPGDARYGLNHHHYQPEAEVETAKSIGGYAYSIPDSSIYASRNVYGPPGYQPGLPISNDYLSPTIDAKYAAPIAVQHSLPIPQITKTVSALPLENIRTALPSATSYGTPLIEHAQGLRTIQTTPIGHGPALTTLTRNTFDNAVFGERFQPALEGIQLQGPQSIALGKSILHTPQFAGRALDRYQPFAAVKSVEAVTPIQPVHTISTVRTLEPLAPVQPVQPIHAVKTLPTLPQLPPLHHGHAPKLYETVTAAPLPLPVRTYETVTPAPLPLPVRTYETVTPAPLPLPVRTYETVTPAPLPLPVRTYETVTPAPLPLPHKTYEAVTAAPLHLPARSFETVTPAPLLLPARSYGPVTPAPLPLPVKTYETVTTAPLPLPVRTYGPVTPAPLPLPIKTYESVTAAPLPLPARIYGPATAAPLPLPIKTYESVTAAPLPLPARGYGPVTTAPLPLPIKTYESVTTSPLPLLARGYGPATTAPLPLPIKTYESVTTSPLPLLARGYGPATAAPLPLPIKTYESITAAPLPLPTKTIVGPLHPLPAIRTLPSLPVERIHHAEPIHHVETLPHPAQSVEILPTAEAPHIRTVGVLKTPLIKHHQRGPITDFLGTLGDKFPLPSLPQLPALPSLPSIPGFPFQPSTVAPVDISSPIPNGHALNGAGHDSITVDSPLSRSTGIASTGFVKHATPARSYIQATDANGGYIY